MSIRKGKSLKLMIQQDYNSERMKAMDTLTNQFYDVMHKYEKTFGIAGVQKNLEQWSEGKRDLLALLRRHSDWHEEELAVVLQYDEIRDIDATCVREAVFEMKQLARDCGLRDNQYDNFVCALDAATIDCRRIPDESRLADIRSHGGIECAPGQKASRIVNRLCLKFGLDRYTAEKEESAPDGTKTVRRVHPYNAIFARLSDALNPGTERRKGILSIHPCDYLEMSNDDNTWRSCHCLNDGEYQAGTLSYMGDTVTMIFYTVNPDVEEAFHKVPRITREVFCYHDGTLLQSRLYPSDRADQRERYMELVEQVITTCLGVPNQWTTQAVTHNTKDFWRTYPNALHYKDYECGYAIVSVLLGEEFHHEIFTIGSQAYCVCCGEELRYEDVLDCSRCESKAICKECGREVSYNHYNYDPERHAFFCDECFHHCFFCNKVFQGEVYRVHRHGQTHSMTACRTCYENLTQPCGTCRCSTACKIVDASAFCGHAKWLPEAA